MHDHGGAHRVASVPRTRLLTGVTIGPPSTAATSGSATWLAGGAAQLADALVHHLQPMHVAFGQVAAAGVQRHLPRWRIQVLEGQEFVGLLRLDEAVLDQAQQHAAGEILIGLHDVHILRAELRHVPHVLRHGLEMRRRHSRAHCAPAPRCDDGRPAPRRAGRPACAAGPWRARPAPPAPPRRRRFPGSNRTAGGTAR